MHPISGSDQDKLPAGVWPVMLTPFTPDGAIDWAGVEGLTEWYLAAGVAGLFAICLSSEMYRLSDCERVALASRIVQQVNGRVPVVTAGAFGTTVPALARAVSRLADTGVDAVVVSTNHLAHVDESDAIWQERMERLLVATGDLPLGLYECPEPYHRLLTPQLLSWAATTGRFRFHKDTACAIAPIRAKLTAISGTPLRWFNANGPTLTMSLQAGGDGYSGIAANFIPDIVVRLYHAVTHHGGTSERLQYLLSIADRLLHHKYPMSAKIYLQRCGLPIHPTCRVDADHLTEAELLALDHLRELQLALSTRVPTEVLT